MTSKPVRNVAASNRAKLLSLARQRGEDFQFLLGRWTIERFLFRLSNSAHKNDFLLKGAMLFLAWEGRLHRPTRDLDLSGFGSSDVTAVAHRVAAICAVHAGDGIDFDLAGIEGERIREGEEYEGVRVRVPTSLDGARTVMSIDVGFGDFVDPPPVEITFPVLLPLDPPVLRAYPPEAVIAEKVQAMTVLGIANSRMKDFFDVWMLSRIRSFDLEQLSRSIRGVFERRRTPLPEGAPLALTPDFFGDPLKQKQWNAFGSRIGLKELPPLARIGGELADFILPVLSAAGALTPAKRTWSPGGPWARRE